MAGGNALFFVRDAHRDGSSLVIDCDLLCDPPLPLDSADRPPAPRTPDEPNLWVAIDGVEVPSIGPWEFDDDEASTGSPFRVDDTIDWTAGEGHSLSIEPAPRTGTVTVSVAWPAQGLARQSLSFDLPPRPEPVPDPPTARIEIVGGPTGGVITPRAD
ncbi:MAG: hypothetical protein QM582_00420 [Micropruina sp.]|uniref:hypothetical protein n=1 Tax=Micropruina sp. TaxID=2737536 RepID=UPI0039E4EF51